MRLHQGKFLESSRSFSFFLENLSTAPPMKKIGGAKGALLLAARVGAVAPLLVHVLGVVLNWVTFFFFN